jgi:hypothetical protein
MPRLWETVSWLCISVGVFLLACSVLLVPANPSFADDGGSVRPDLACTPTCPPSSEPPRGSCGTAYPGICALVGLPCVNMPAGICDGCACNWDGDKGICWCH